MIEITQEEALLLSILAMTEVYHPEDVKGKAEIMRSLKGVARKIAEGIVGNRRGLSKEIVDISLKFLQWAKEQNGKAH